jgi:2-dehydro-3-deoxygalactonokinase
MMPTHDRALDMRQGHAVDLSAPPTFVGMDAGTTNTRVWLVAGDRVLARAEAPVGARDTARDGHDRALRAAVRELIAEVRAHAPSGVPAPACVAAAGMITSAQGLHEVPHVTAPVGVAELAAGARDAVLPNVADLPFLFIPGVRTAPDPAPPGVGARDVMRGEETLAIGLVGQGHLAAASALLNVGSHWKLIRIDEAGRVAGSVTSLAGETMQAVRTETILASALPPGPLAAPDVRLLLDGMDEARASGLARALFCVRLLDLAGTTTPEGRLSFLIGAFIGADLAGLQGRGHLAPGTAVTIAGDEKTGGAWRLALEHAGHRVQALTPAEIEAGFLAGLAAIVAARGIQGRAGTSVL